MIPCSKQTHARMQTASEFSCKAVLKLKPTREGKDRMVAATDRSFDECFVRLSHKCLHLNYTMHQGNSNGVKTFHLVTRLVYFEKKMKMVLELLIDADDDS
jgi:hypothetical protein